MGANIGLRKDGRYVSYVWAEGKRQYIYGHTEQEVRTKLRELSRDDASAVRTRVVGKRTVADLLEALLSASDLRPKTVYGYRQTMGYILPALGNARLSTLEPLDLQRLYAGLATRSKRTAYRAHLLLHRALRVAVLWGWLDSNPADRVLKPQYRYERKELWTVEQMRTFLDATREHKFGPLWLLALATGMRLGELLALRWVDYDEAARSLTVSGSLQYVAGAWIKGSPKTKAGKRILTIPESAADAIDAQRQAQEVARLSAGSGWQENGLIFTNVHGGPVQQTWVQNAMKKECERLGLPALTPHGLRHMHATLLLDQGLPITAVGARLGHANPSVTLQVYSHALKGQDRQAAEAIGRALEGT